MSVFLDYLEDFNEKNIVKEEVIQKKKTIKEKKSKVLCLNVEVRSVKGAQLVIEKLQDWISRCEDVGSNKKVIPESKKKPFRIKPKQVKTNTYTEARNHAVDILDGLPDEPVVSEQTLQNNINNLNQQPHKPQFNMKSVAGHASALL